VLSRVEWTQTPTLDGLDEHDARAVVAGLCDDLVLRGIV
jgi:hypothetical protein